MYSTFPLPVVPWEAQEADERDDDERGDAGVVDKRRTLFRRAGVILPVSRKRISASPLSVTCVCQIDSWVPFTDQNNYCLCYCK